MTALIKKYFFPVFSLVMGAMGFCLRDWLFIKGQEGLLPENHIAGILSFLLLATVLAVLAWAVRKMDFSENYDKLFPRSAFAGVGIALGAVGMGCAAFSVDAVAALRLLLPILAVIGAGALLLGAYCRFRGSRPNCLFYGLFAVYLILYTLARCRDWGRETQLQMYFFPLLTLLFLLMACYYRAELATRLGNCRRYVFFAQAALFCCCVSLRGEDWLFYLSGAVWMAADFCSLSFRGQDE